MRLRLPHVISESDLPAPELRAVCLDGDAYPVGDAVAPLDEIPSPRQRATALAAVLPAKLIVERWSAAWVWGALAHPPTRHTVCADINARFRPPPHLRLSVREVVIDSEALCFFGAIAVTSPLRTVTDIVRWSATFGATERRVVGALVEGAGLKLDDFSRDTALVGNFPGARRARSRLELCQETAIQN